jgi:O-antigen/teichoic acid export membrane protein
VLAAPLQLGLAVTSDVVVETLFGAKWVAMAPLASLISLAMPFMTLQILFAPALNALGKPGITARTAAFGAVILPLSFLIGAQYGAIGLACAWLVAMPLHTAFSYLQARPHIGINMSGLCAAVAPSVSAALGMALLVGLLKGFLADVAAPIAFATLTMAGVLIYAGLLRLLAPHLIEQVIGLVFRRKAPVQALSA